MKYAVIQTGGKQYLVKEGDVLKIEKIKRTGVEKEKVRFEDVLFVKKENEVKIGTPRIEGAYVEAEILGEGKGKKVLAFRYKPKKRVRVRRGHRQPYTEIKITEIHI